MITGGNTKRLLREIPADDRDEQIQNVQAKEREMMKSRITVLMLLSWINAA